VVNQAYTIAALDIFWLSGVMVVLLIPLLWLAKRSMSGGGAVAGGE